LPSFKPKKLWNIHATMHGISALSVISFIDIKLVKCDLSPWDGTSVRDPATSPVNQ
jgi:hypothetical protein